MYYLRVYYYDNLKKRCFQFFESEMESEAHAKKAFELLERGFNLMNGTRIYADLFFKGEFIKEL